MVNVYKITTFYPSNKVKNIIKKIEWLIHLKSTNEELQKGLKIHLFWGGKKFSSLLLASLKKETAQGPDFDQI